MVDAPASPIATQETEITSAIKRLREVAPQQPADPRLHWLAPVYVQPLDVRIVLEALFSAERRNEELVRERLAAWMIQHGIATGHGDTFEDLLGELSAHVRKMQADRAPSPNSLRLLADAVISRDATIASLTGQVGEMRTLLDWIASRLATDGFEHLAQTVRNETRRALEPSPPGISTTGGDGAPTPSPKAPEPAPSS